MALIWYVSWIWHIARGILKLQCKTLEFRATSYSGNSQANIQVTHNQMAVLLFSMFVNMHLLIDNDLPNGPRQANLVLIAYASSEGSGEPAHPRSLARTSAARSYKQWVKRNLQTENQIPGPSEWLGMRS